MELSNSTPIEPTHRSYVQYLVFFFTQYISLIGSQVVGFAVAWFLAAETGSTLILSLSAIAYILPMILVSPIAGVIGDKHSKKLILLGMDGMQALATFALIVLFYFDKASIAFIIGLMAVRGFCQGFQMPVAVTFTSLMVPKEKIKFVNGMDQFFRSILSLGSPVLGALAIQFYALSQIYWLDVITFIPGGIVLLIISVPKITQTESQEDASFVDQFKEGLQYIKESQLVPPFILFAAANFFVVPIFSLFPLYITNYHGGGVVEYSIVEILFQVGLLVGSIVLISNKKEPTMRAVIKNGFLLSVIVLLFAIVPRQMYWLLYTICLILGFVLAFIDSNLLSVMQIKIPQNIQGRVFSTMFVVIKSINPLGLIIWGALGEVVNIIWIFSVPPILSLILYVILIPKTNMLHWDELNMGENTENSEKPDGDGSEQEDNQIEKIDSTKSIESLE